MPHDLTPGDGQDLLARLKEARERRDVDALMDLFAETAEVRLDPFEPPIPDGLALREHWNGVVAEQLDVEFDAERVWVSGHTVLASWHSAWTSRANGSRLRERGFCTLELDPDGQVSRMRAWPIVRVVSSGADEAVGAPGQAREEEDGR